MKRFLSVAFLFAAAALSSCAGNKAQAQEQVVECDILFEYHHVANDSITLLVGNTMRLNTGKADPGQFYPLLVSIRNPQDLDKPTNTEVIHDDAALLALLGKSLPLLKTFGVVIGENTSEGKNFTESGALVPIRNLVKDIPDAKILLFHEKKGDIVDVETVQ